MTRYTFRDYLRSRRFAILLVIIGLVGGGLSAALAYYGTDTFTAGAPASSSTASLAFYSGFWGSFVQTVAVLAGIFFGGDAISGEFQNKTGYFMIPNPIRRSSVYIGKWLAAFIAGSIALFVYAAFSVANGLYYGFSIPLQFGDSLLFAWFYLVAVLGFTFFFSSLFKSSAYSFVVTFVLFFLAFGIIDLVASAFAHIEPWFLLTYGAGIISNILVVPYPAHEAITSGIFGRGGPGTATLTSYNVTIPEGLAIIGIYFLVTAILGLILFERKEFN